MLQKNPPYFDIGWENCYEKEPLFNVKKWNSNVYIFLQL